MRVAYQLSKFAMHVIRMLFDIEDGVHRPKVAKRIEPRIKVLWSNLDDRSVMASRCNLGLGFIGDGGERHQIKLDPLQVAPA